MDSNNRDSVLDNMLTEGALPDTFPDTLEVTIAINDENEISMWYTRVAASSIWGLPVYESQAVENGYILIRSSILKTKQENISIGYFIAEGEITRD